MANSTIKRPENSNRMDYPNTYNNTRFRFFGYTDGSDEINLMIPMAFAMSSPTHPGTVTITNLKISAFGVNGIINSTNWDVTSYIHTKLEIPHDNAYICKQKEISEM